MERTWLALALLAGCGTFSHGKLEQQPPADVTPDPIDWPDFDDVSVSAPITGIDVPIALDVTAGTISGSPVVEMRTNGGAWQAPGTVTMSDGNTLQFRVTGMGGDTAHIMIVNTSDADAVIDDVVGTSVSSVRGSGTSTDPYTAPTTPDSCAAFLAAYPKQQGLDGSYTLRSLVAYCDMTTDGGGWTLAARVLAMSTTHDTASAVGTLTDPAQNSTAKLADATINALGFSYVRIAIENTGTVYATVTTLDLSGTPFSDTNAAAAVYAGPYTGEFLTMVSCSSDCGVAIMRPGMGFGNNCGYRYYGSQNNPTAGMGCQGNHGIAGTLWVQ